MRIAPPCASCWRSRRTMVDLPAPLGPTIATVSPSRTEKLSAASRPRGARIREADGVERDLRPQARDARRIGGRCMTLRVEQRVDRIRRRLADHPWCSTARRSRSGRKISLPAISTISSASGSCRRAARATRRPRSRRPRRAGAEIGEEPRQQAEREHQNVLSDSARAFAASFAPNAVPCPNAFSVGGPHRVEELLAERLERRRACECRACRRDARVAAAQRDERRDQQDRGRRHPTTRAPRRSSPARTRRSRAVANRCRKRSAIARRRRRRTASRRPCVRR